MGTSVHNIGGDGIIGEGGITDQGGIKGEGPHGIGAYKAHDNSDRESHRIDSDRRILMLQYLVLVDM